MRSNINPQYAPDGRSLAVSARITSVCVSCPSSGYNAMPTLALRLSSCPAIRCGSLIEATQEGGKYFTGYARSRGFREYRGLGWITVVRQPVDRVFGPVGDLQRSIFGWGLAFTAGLTVATWVVSGRTARRLNSMAAAAERMREGDVLTVLPRPHSNDEYGRMCGSVGALVEELREQKGLK